jgi:hypothetical protein
MIIDCDHCEVRNIACDDCVVSVLLAAPSVEESEGGDGNGSRNGSRNIEWQDDESGALRALAQVGLIPPLRMRSGRGRPPGGRAVG